MFHKCISNFHTIICSSLFITYHVNFAPMDSSLNDFMKISTILIPFFQPVYLCFLKKQFFVIFNSSVGILAISSSSSLSWGFTSINCCFLFDSSYRRYIHAHVLFVKMLCIGQRFTNTSPGLTHINATFVNATLELCGIIMSYLCLTRNRKIEFFKCTVHVYFKSYCNYYEGTIFLCVFNIAQDAMFIKILYFQSIKKHS